MGIREDNIKAAIQNLSGGTFERFAFRVLREEEYPGLNPTSESHDLGEDARTEPTSLFLHHGKWVSVSTSKTAELSKLRKDCERARETGRRIDIIVFATSGEVRRDTEEKWREEVKNDFGWDLVVHSIDYFAPIAARDKHASLVEDYLQIPPQGGDFLHAIEIEFERLTSQALETATTTVEGLEEPLTRTEVSTVEDQLKDGKQVLLTGEAGTGKSGIATMLARSAEKAGRGVIFLDARRTLYINSEKDFRDYFNLNGPVDGAIARVARKKGCRVIIDQFDNAVGRTAAEQLTNLARACRQIENTETIVISRKIEYHEEESLKTLLDAGFVELTSHPLTETKVLGVIDKLGVSNAPAELIDACRNLLNLSLVATIKKNQPAYDFSNTLNEIDLWEGFIGALIKKEGGAAQPNFGEEVAAEAMRLAIEGLRRDDRMVILRYPRSLAHQRLISWQVIIPEEEDIHRFRHERMQDYLVAWDAFRKGTLPSEILREFDKHRTLGVFAWIDKLYARRPNSSQRRKFLKELFTLSDVPFYALTAVLQRYISSVNPAEDQVALQHILEALRNEEGVRSYFFRSRPHSRWAHVLWEEGFFDHPPEPVQDSERGTIIYPNWPESKYLERMAAIDSLRLKRTIVGIALKVVTDNPTVYLDLTKAVLQMPANMQVDWANKMAAWLGREVFVHPLLPEQLGNLASSLAEGGYTNTSIDLLRILLAVQQDPRESGEGSEAIWAPQPRPRFNLWHYAKVIRKNVPVLTKASPMDALSLLCDLLEEALELSWTGEKGDEGVQDYWRPSIDAGRNDRLLDALVSGVRDVAAQIAGNDPSQVPAIIESLETRPFRIFRRLSLHLLHSFPDAAPHLAAKRLTDRENFDNHGLRREYNELLKSCFARLDEAQQSWIMSWIEEGPQNVENFKESFESWYERPIMESDIDEYVNKWKLERMDPFREALTDVWKETYERLASQYGRQVSDQGLPYMVSETTEYISPKSPEELGGMGLDDLVSYLESWNPSENAEGYSLLGLESALRTTILNIPEHFSNRAEEFKNLRPVFIRALISALTSALDQGRKIQWKPVLNLCTFIAAKPLSFPAGGDDKSNEHDRLFAQLKKESSSLIRKGIRADESRIPDALGQTVFELIRSLINGLPQINTEQLNNKNRSTAEAVIYARATALEDIIRCAYWVHEMRQANSGDTTVEAQASGYSGELRKILDRNLDLNIDPDLRLRKVYGESFPILVYLEHEWASRNVPTIFPLAEMERPLFEAAWQSYVLYSGYYAPAFEMLKEQYRVAIVRLGTAATVEVYGVDPDRQLAQHIMVYYVSGNSDLNDEESIINSFFRVASQSLRESAVSFVGEDLRGTEGDIKPEILSRLQALWSKRFGQARVAASMDDYKDELAAFGWWFVSEKFDEKWSVKQLREVLLVIKKVDADDFVVERLAALASKYPRIAVECLSLMIEGDEEGYGVELWKTAAQELLRTALKQDTDHDARTDAFLLINRISARGAIDYAYLLVE